METPTCSDSDRLHAPNREPDYYARRIRSDEYRAERPRKAEIIASIFDDDIARADRAVSLGCGTGIVADTLENRLGTPIVRIDLHPEFIERRDRAIAGDVLRLPLRDESFGAVICNHLYEHVSDRPQLFREVYRILEPGGACYVAAGNQRVIIEPHYRLPFLSWLPKPLADCYVRMSGRGRNYEGIDFSSYRQLKKWMQDAGLVVEDRTEELIERNLNRELTVLGRALWTQLRFIPATLRQKMLQLASPQWRLIGKKPGHPSAGSC